MPKCGPTGSISPAMLRHSSARESLTVGWRWSTQAFSSYCSTYYHFPRKRAVDYVEAFIFGKRGARAVNHAIVPALGNAELHQISRPSPELPLLSRSHAQVVVHTTYEIKVCFKAEWNSCRLFSRVSARMAYSASCRVICYTLALRSLEVETFAA